jgi:hypothetical protein
MPHIPPYCIYIKKKEKKLNICLHTAAVGLFFFSPVLLIFYFFFCFFFYFNLIFSLISLKTKNINFRKYNSDIFCSLRGA